MVLTVLISLSNESIPTPPKNSYLLQQSAYYTIWTEVSSFVGEIAWPLGTVHIEEVFAEHWLNHKQKRASFLGRGSHECSNLRLMGSLGENSEGVCLILPRRKPRQVCTCLPDEERGTQVNQFKPNQVAITGQILEKRQLPLRMWPGTRLRERD